jgi:hypothetical protein
MSLLSEKRDVQDQLIDHLIGVGREYLPPADVAAARGGDAEPPFKASSNPCSINS